MIRKFITKHDDFYTIREAFDKSFWRNLLEKINYKSFLYSNVRPNSVLIVEPNNSAHGEVLPYFIKYFLDKGYNVDVVVSPWIKYIKWLSLNSSPKLRKFAFRTLKFRKFLSSKCFKYKFILFTSKIVYHQGKEPSIFDYIKNIEDFRDKIYFVEHHMDRIDYEKEKEHAIVLANLPSLENKINWANPHYFGNVKITPKSDVTKFIVVGWIESKRRDFEQFIKTLEKMENSNVTNYHITLIGRAKPEIPAHLEKYFTFKGYLKADQMIKEMENADFFLTLLNDENEEHLRYITTGTSGSFQLVYGFLKPCLIQKSFADVYDFNSENSIVYNNGNDLADAMIKAINMSKQNYANMQRKLKELVCKIEEASQKNLDKYFNDNAKL